MTSRERAEKALANMLGVRRIQELEDHENIKTLRQRQIATLTAAIDQAVAEENEACAKVADRNASEWPEFYAKQGHEIAAAIRARKEKP